MYSALSKIVNNDNNIVIIFFLYSVLLQPMSQLRHVSFSMGVLRQQDLVRWKLKHGVKQCSTIMLL